MAPAGGRDEGESRAAADDTAHSSSGASDHEDDEIATISDVFADMLIANEDLLHAAAEYQLDNDVPSILAYQRILHHNLIEMADFVDSVFGVYNKLDLGDSKDTAAMETEEEKEEDESAQEVSATDLHDEANGHTSEESSEPAKKAQPVRMRSLLIDRFRLENKRRLEQRTARLWRKMRRKVRVEEGVSVVMTQAVERIAQMTVSAAAAREPPREPTTATRAPPVDTKPSAATSKPSTPDLSVGNARAQVPAQASKSPPQSPQEVVPAETSVNEPTAPSSTASPTPPSSTNPAQPSANSNTSDIAQAPLPQPTLPMPLLTSPMPFAQQGNAMLVPAGANTFTKVPLPPMSSGLNMFYPMAVPTMFPPNHMSSVCADCVPLNRTAHECRSVLKHITPPPPSAQSMMLGTPSMWPMAFNSVMNVPQPVRSVPPMRSAQSTASSTFKKMCEECKKNHKSVHHCRKILGHTAPEWLSGLPESDPKPRKRRTRRQKGIDDAAAQQLASAASAQAKSVNAGVGSAATAPNEI